MKSILASLLLTSCTIELRESKQSSSSYSPGYTTSTPAYYEWFCEDDDHYYDAWIDVEAVDCNAFKVTASVETYDYYVAQEDLTYYGGCDWYSYVYVPGETCYDIYDVRVKSYY